MVKVLSAKPYHVILCLIKLEKRVVRFDSDSHVTTGLPPPPLWLAVGVGRCRGFAVGRARRTLMPCALGPSPCALGTRQIAGIR